MKNRLVKPREKLFASSFYKNAPRPVRWIIGSLSNNLGYKLLSLLLAVLVTYAIEKPAGRLLDALRAKVKRKELT